MTERNEEEFVVLTVDAPDVGTRLDSFVAGSVPELTRSAVLHLIADGNVTVNGKTEAKNYRTRAGDEIEVILPEPEIGEAEPQNIPIDVIYEDDDLIVVNKPVGMVVHPAPGNPDGTLVNALLYHCRGSLSGIGGVIRPGIVHRIDKDTSGLLVVAKNDRTHLALAEKIKTHEVRRIYYAVALGNLREDEGTVDAPIGRHPTDRKRMAVIRDTEKRARGAVTHWKVLARGSAEGSSFTLIRCELETGRTHQIRVHMASVGHPLLGDSVYGGAGTAFEARHRAWIEGQTLHAGELIFTHPASGKEMRFRAPMPEKMKTVVGYLFGESVPTEIG